MEEGMKKTIKIVVIIVCLSLAGVLFYRSCTYEPPGGISSIDPDQMTWIKCRNTACGHEYEMNLREYFLYMEEHIDSAFHIAPPMLCPECGEESCYEAVKCEKCGVVFEPGWKPGDFSDRCPNLKCSHSKQETDRKKAAEARKKGQGGG